MRTALALIAATVALSLAVPAAGAGDPAPPDAQAAAKPTPECFFVRDVRNETVGGNHTVYFNVRNRDTWRMPPLARLPPLKLSLGARASMGALRLYLVVAGGLVLVRIVTLAIGRG